MDYRWNMADPSNRNSNMGWDQPAHNLTEDQRTAIFDCMKEEVTDPTAIAIVVGVTPGQVQAFQKQIEELFNSSAASTEASPWGDIPDQHLQGSGSSSSYDTLGGGQSSHVSDQNPPDFDLESFLNAWGGQASHTTAENPPNSDFDSYLSAGGGEPSHVPDQVLRAPVQAKLSSPRHESSPSHESSPMDDTESLFGDTRYGTGESPHESPGLALPGSGFTRRQSIGEPDHASQAEPSHTSSQTGDVQPAATGSSAERAGLISPGPAFSQPGQTAKSPGGTVYTADEGLKLKTGQFAGISADKKRYLLNIDQTGFERPDGVGDSDTRKRLRVLFDEKTGLSKITKASTSFGFTSRRLSTIKANLRKAAPSPEPEERHWPHSEHSSDPRRATGSAAPGAPVPQASTSNAAPAEVKYRSEDNNVGVTPYPYFSRPDQVLMGRLGFKRGQDNDRNNYVITPEGNAYRIKGQRRGVEEHYKAEAIAAFRALKAAADNATPQIGHATVSVLFGQSTNWLKNFDPKE